MWSREVAGVWRWLASKPGEVVAGDVAGWPLFVVVAPDGSLSGFPTSVLTTPGRSSGRGMGVASNLVCRYHGWAYDSKGRCSAPGLCNADLTEASHGRVPIRVAKWRKLVW